MPRVLDKQRSVASIPEISLISVVENGEKFVYGKCSTPLYFIFFSGFTKEHYHYRYWYWCWYCYMVTASASAAWATTSATGPGSCSVLLLLLLLDY